MGAPSRGMRRVLVGSGIALLLGAGTMLSVQNGAAEGWVAAGTSADVEAAGAVYLDEEGVFVTWDDGDLHAFSDASPHMDDERILFCRSGRFFVAPHGEKFTQDGQWIGGPAESDLHTVPVRVEDGEVQVEPDNVVTSKTKGPPALFPPFDEPDLPPACFSGTADEDPLGFVPDS